MHQKLLYICALLLVCALAASCGFAGVSTQTPAAPTQAPTPSPSPTPTPMPTPLPTPTQTPEPTPTPDPWAEFFSDEPAFSPYSKSGPWFYKDKELSVTINVVKKEKRSNYIAEIYTRGLLFYSGAANPAKPKSYTEKMPWYIARNYGAVFGVNGDYWFHDNLESKSNEPKIRRKRGVVIRGGTVLLNEKESETLAIMPDGELKVFEKGTVDAKALQEMGVKDSFSFGPVLVRDGAVNPDMKKHQIYRIHGGTPNYRCSIGMVEPGHYFCVVTDKTTNLKQLAELYVELGCKLAYNLDGGNSAAMVFMGEQINFKYKTDAPITGQRAISDMLLIGRSDMVPGVKDKVQGMK